MRQIIDRAGPHMSGQLVNWKGEALPWWPAAATLGAAGPFDRAGHFNNNDGPHS